GTLKLEARGCGTTAPGRILVSFDFPEAPDQNGCWWPSSQSQRRDSAMKRLVCGVAVLSLLSALTEQASAQYTFTTLASINPSAQLAAPLAINNRGQIVGFDLNTATGFLLNGTNFSLVGPPGAILSQAWGINDSGDIVGGLVIPPARTFGFLYSGGNYT